MADILCPNCGKLNPSDEDTCQYCQASLKPKDASQTPSTPAFLSSSDEGGELPDWLQDLRGFEESGTGEALGGESKGAWLQEPEGSTAGEGASEEPGTPDWLSRLGGQEEAAFPTEEPSQPAKESLPEWLPGASEGDIPDWFPKEAQPKDESFAIPEESEPSESAQPAEEGGLPDWLTQAGAGSEFAGTQGEDLFGTAKEEAPAAPFESGSDVPDWLSNLSAQEQPAEETKAQGEPDWFRSAGDQAAEQPPSVPTPAFDESSLAGLREEEVLPDWLKRLDANGIEPPPGGTPALSLGEEAPPPVAPSSEPSGPVEAQGLPSEPEWLSQVSPEQAAPSEPPPAQEAEGEADLAKATLPGWLEAMRPVETAAPSAPFVDTSDDHVEGAGPLAGLRGVLSAEPDVAQLRKPSVYSIKVQVPTEQQSRLDMLQKLVETEAETKPLPSPAAVSLSSIMRLVIFVLLVLAVIWTLSGTSIMPVPEAQSIPSEITNFHALVEALPPQSQVLVSFDYEPGFSGELDASIAAMLNHLDRKGASVVAVSTNINGPYLAERMVQMVNSQTDRLGNTPVRWMNLGYIPGGSAGLQAFAGAPSRLMQFTLEDGKNPWNGNPLDFQKELQNFAMVVVITENADTARAWVEQVGPALQSGAGQIPLMMIVSGQTEPMVRPYYDGGSQQVQGVLAGLRGGAIYESLIGRSGIARQAWDAYSLTILVSVLLILFGLSVSAVVTAISRMRRSKVEGTA